MEDACLFLGISLSPGLWVDAHPILVFQLAAEFIHPGNKIFQGAAWGKRVVKFKFNIYSNAQYSSVL